MSAISSRILDSLRANLISDCRVMPVSLSSALNDNGQAFTASRNRFVIVIGFRFRLLMYYFIHHLKICVNSPAAWRIHKTSHTPCRSPAGNLCVGSGLGRASNLPGYGGPGRTVTARAAAAASLVAVVRLRPTSRQVGLPVRTAANQAGASAAVFFLQVFAWSE